MLHTSGYGTSLEYATLTRTVTVVTVTADAFFNFLLVNEPLRVATPTSNLQTRGLHLHHFKMDEDTSIGISMTFIVIGWFDEE